MEAVLPRRLDTNLVAPLVRPAWTYRHRLSLKIYNGPARGLSSGVPLISSLRVNRSLQSMECPARGAVVPRLHVIDDPANCRSSQSHSNVTTTAMLASSGQQSQSTGSVDVASIFLPTPRSGLPPYNTRITGSQWTLIISDDNENLAKAVLLQGRRNLMTTLVSLHSLKETGMKSSTGDGAQSSQATAESARIQTLLHAGDDVLSTPICLETC